MLEIPEIPMTARCRAGVEPNQGVASDERAGCESGPLLRYRGLQNPRKCRGLDFLQSMVTPVKRVPVLEVLVDDLSLEPALTALCAGYEDNDWRADQLAGWMFDELPAFALNWSTRQEMRDDTARRLMLRAAHAVYASDKYSRRGEFGELLLHCILRELFDSEPAVSKLFYKDSANDTVKGFDAVHVVATAEDLELWLGEVKFYSDAAAAIRDVAAELEAHTRIDYLRGEFVTVTGKIDDSWPSAPQLKRLLDPNTKIDDIFDAVTIPVLITYDSKTVAGHSSWADPYRETFETEVRRHYAAFCGHKLPDKVRLRLLLVPLQSKERLVGVLHQKLKAWQNL
jgi:Cap4 SAVED domain